MRDIRLWCGDYPNMTAPPERWRGTERVVHGLATRLDDLGLSVALDPTPGGVATYCSRVLISAEDSRPFERLGADYRIMWVLHGNPNCEAVDLADKIVFSSGAQIKDVRSRHRNIDPDKCMVIPNGVDNPVKGKINKVAGRILYASAPERGLHHCLRIFARIKKQVPYAELHITYGVHDFIRNNRWNSNAAGLAALEIESRLTDPGVVVSGELGPEDMGREMAEATMLMYPCDPIRMSENYCVTVGEAVLADTIPLTSTADALYEVWGRFVPQLPLPINDDHWVDIGTRILTDRRLRSQVRKGWPAGKLTFGWDLTTQMWRNLVFDLDRQFGDGSIADRSGVRLKAA